MEPDPLQQGNIQLNFILHLPYLKMAMFLYEVVVGLQTYVRDIYPFRRSVSPQLNLVHMLPEKGQELIQKQVCKISYFSLKCSKVEAEEWELKK